MKILQTIKKTKLKLLTLPFLAASAQAEQINGEEAIWKPEMTLEVKLINDVDVSPDGKEVIYSVKEANLEKNTYTTQIWKGKVGDVRTHTQYTSGENSSSNPRWSPDGKSIAFLSNRTGVNNLYIISPDGGEAIQVTDFKEGIETFQWSPDSQSIAFVAKTENLPHERKSPNLSDEIEKSIHHQKDSQLFVIKALPSMQVPVQITTNHYQVVGEIDFHTILEAFDWSPDSNLIAFTYTPKTGQDSRWKNSQIAIVDVQTKKIEKLPTLAPHQSIPKFSPDGNTIAFLKSDDSSSYSLTRHITLYSLTTKKFIELQKTPDESPFLVGPSLLGWSVDGSSILYLEPYRTKFALWSIPVNGGKMIRVDDGKWTFTQPLLSRNRKWLGIPLETLETASEAYVTSSSVFSPKKVSQVNDHLKKWNMPHTKVTRWKSRDGKEVEGLVTYPRGYRPGNRYPFLLVVHGGPMGVFSESYLGTNRTYPVAAFADAGFVVLRANPRGSCGYGRDFRYAVCSDWGGNDFQDLMSGVDALISSGLVDPNRMGVMGWSYGGYMTAWTISQTNRFAAASMGAGVSNLMSFSGTTDIHHFISDYLGSEIWEDSSLYLKRSPISFVNNVSTPLLIQHGENDPRTPLSQAFEFYHALQKQNKPVTLAVYPRSTHRISEPKLYLDALQRNFDWFVENVKDKS